MAERRVTHIRTDQEGNITFLCHPGQGWSPVGQHEAMLDIAADYHRYYALIDGRRIDVSIGSGPTGHCLMFGAGEAAGEYLKKMPEAPVNRRATQRTKSDL